MLTAVRGAETPCFKPPPLLMSPAATQVLWEMPLQGGDLRCHLHGQTTHTEGHGHCRALALARLSEPRDRVAPEPQRRGRASLLLCVLRSQLPGATTSVHSGRRGGDGKVGSLSRGDPHSSPLWTPCHDALSPGHQEWTQDPSAPRLHVSPGPEGRWPPQLLPREDHSESHRQVPGPRPGAWPAPPEAPQPLGRVCHSYCCPGTLRYHEAGGHSQDGHLLGGILPAPGLSSLGTSACAGRVHPGLHPGPGAEDRLTTVRRVPGVDTGGCAGRPGRRPPRTPAQPLGTGLHGRSTVTGPERDGRGQDGASSPGQSHPGPDPTPGSPCTCQAPPVA